MCGGQERGGNGGRGKRKMGLRTGKKENQPEVTWRRHGKKTFSFHVSHVITKRAFRSLPGLNLMIDFGQPAA